MRRVSRREVVARGRKSSAARLARTFIGQQATIVWLALVAMMLGSLASLRAEDEKPAEPKQPANIVSEPAPGSEGQADAEEAAAPPMIRIRGLPIIKDEKPAPKAEEKKQEIKEPPKKKPPTSTLKLRIPDEEPETPKVEPKKTPKGTARPKSAAPKQEPPKTGTSPKTDAPKTVKPKTPAEEPAEVSISDTTPTPRVDPGPRTVATMPADAELKVLHASLETSTNVDAQAARLKGVQPGTTTAAELATGRITVDGEVEEWGQPVRRLQQGGFTRHVYQLAPFKEVTVSFRNNVVVSITVQFQQPFTADQLARDLALDAFEAVVITADNGELLGQVYPERGVLFSYLSSTKRPPHVQQIVLKEIDSEPFVQRAEANLTRNYRSALDDVATALKLSPNLVRARWLKARVLVAAGNGREALKVINEVLHDEPTIPEYRLIRVKALDLSGDFVRAGNEARQIIGLASAPEYVRATAMLYLGDLIAHGPGRDYKQALEMHQSAIQTAEPLLVDSNLHVRQAAQSVLIDAHLAVALDVAWGRWKNKPSVVPKWLQQAEGLSKAATGTDWVRTEYEFHTACDALNAFVGMQQPLAKTAWAEKALQSGHQLLAATEDPLRRQQLHWKLGSALHDALQLYLIENQFDPSLKYGTLAVRHLEAAGQRQRTAAGATYMMARCYFRVGSIYALHYQDHKQAVTWFDKAVPLLEGKIPVSALADIGRQGETLVSIGVSYWEVGRKDDALRVTTRGLELMEQAVKDAILQPTALNVPYSNLAAMHRALGNEAKATEYEQQAGRLLMPTAQ